MQDREGGGDARDDELDAKGQGDQAEDLGEDVHAGVAEETDDGRGIIKRQVVGQGHAADGRRDFQQPVHGAGAFGKQDDGGHGAGPGGQRDGDGHHGERDHLGQGGRYESLRLVAFAFEHAQAAGDQEQAAGNAEGGDGDAEEFQHRRADDQGNDHGDQRTARGHRAHAMLARDVDAPAQVHVQGQGRDVVGHGEQAEQIVLEGHFHDYPSKATTHLLRITATTIS